MDLISIGTLLVLLKTVFLSSFDFGFLIAVLILMPIGTLFVKRIGEKKNY